MTQLVRYTKLYMHYKIIPWVPKNMKIKVLGEKKVDSSLFLPLIEYKSLDKKWIIGYREKSKEIVLSRLNNRYKLYIEMLKIQDNLNNANIYLSDNNEGYLSKDLYLNIIKDKNKVIKLFNENLSIEDSHYLSRKYIRKNILEENYNDLVSRKISNNLLLPHYFFTGRFNEKSMPSQNRSWINSVYIFLKKEKSTIKHIDIYTGKLLKLFFSLKHIKIRRIWNSTLFNVYKIVPHIFIIKYMNRMIRYTSPRSTWSLSKVSNYPSVILTMTWLQKQIRYASILNKYIRSRKNTLFGLYKPKLQAYYRKRRRGWLSKPLFKHTSYNLVIDLFIFNNKKNNIRKFSNIIYRRALYKYMYSMYVDNMSKVRKTLNRPRFFYINLIEPKTYNYYSNIVKVYENLLIKNSKVHFLLVSLLIIKWNHIRKNYIQFIKNNNFFSILSQFIGIKNKNNLFLNYFSLNKGVLYNNEKISSTSTTNSLNILTKGIEKKNNLIQFDISNKIVFKRRLFNKNKNEINKKKEFFFLNKNNEIKRKNIINIEMYDLNKNLFIQKIHNKDQNKKKKNTIGRKPKYLKLRKYLLNLERKSIVSPDLSKLTIWSRKGLGKAIINNKEKKISKIYRHNKYSLEEFKKKIYYAKGKTKRKIAPSLWKAKLMNFYLLSKNQKKDTNPNRNFINYKENELYRYVQHKPKIKDNIKNKVIINERVLNKDKNDVNFKDSNNLNILINKKEEMNSFNEKDINLIKTGVDKIKLNKYKKDSTLFKNIIYNKKEYLKNILNLNKGKKNILYGLFKQFYILEGKKSTYLESISNKKRILFYINPNSISDLNNDNLLSEKKNESFRIVYTNRIKGNSKNLWDSLDFSIINILSNVFMNNNKENNWIRLSSYNNLFNKLNNVVINNDILYLDIVKKEFYNVNRDVILSKVTQEIPNNIDTTTNTYKFTKNYLHNNLVFNFIINNKIDQEINKDKDILGINIWPSHIKDNGRNNYLKYKFEYNEDVFKPYYRYMLPLFIYESYRSFLSYLGYPYLKEKKKTSFFFNINWVKSDNLRIFNFIIVRTLLDLLRYNYRSLVKVKPKYYYLNTIRYYGAKIRRLQFNTWIASVKYIKRLRKTPRHFWKRYNRLASLYYGRIIQSAELNTKRQILLPFVIYFEDLLYIIYGKWAIIRLWPIKRYYLNSYILAERIMIMLVIRRNKWNAIKEYRKSARKLISIFRWFQIKKAYDYINEYNTRWPDSLINNMKDSNSRHSLNYNKLEFFNKKLEKRQMLSIYPIEKKDLKNYLSTVNVHYVQTMYNYIEKLSKLTTIKRMFLKNEGKLKAQVYVRHWLKPLSTYIFTMKQGTDITGIKFRLGGRTGVSASNARRFKKFYFFGNLIGPRHYNKRTRKTTNLTNPILRNTIKSNIDYAYSVGVNRNGCITLKIWLSSLFSSDMQELLLYLMGIKYLYNQLISRYYIVPSKFVNINYNWLLHYNSHSQFYLNDHDIENKHIEKLKLRRIKYKLNKRLKKKREGKK